MGRAPCCDKANVKKGPWSPEEDAKLKHFIEKYGSAGNWIALPQKAGLKRCGKSCRLRWLNYLRPNIKHGEFSDEEDRVICSLYASIGSRWSIIASQLPGRTDNDIKNYWNTKLKKKIMGINNLPPNPPPFPFLTSQSNSLSHLSHLYTSFYDQARKSLPAAADSINFVNANSSHLLTVQNEGLQCYYPMKDNNNMLVFGANEAAASCSSSDGSCSQINYGGVKREEIEGCFQGFVENRNALFEPMQRINGVENSQLQYDLEEVKQLITGGGGGFGGGGNNSWLFADENINIKGGEMGMYYF